MNSGSQFFQATIKLQITVHSVTKVITSNLPIFLISFHDHTINHSVPILAAFTLYVSRRVINHTKLAW